MGLFSRFRKDKKRKETEPGLPIYLYDDSEIEVIDSFICDMFGNYKNVFHEIASPDIHLDVCIVEPTEEDPYYKLVTMGAGAYKMAIPEKWQKYQLDYAEYVIYLPKEWNINSGEDSDYWPIKTLKDVARLPVRREHKVQQRCAELCREQKRRYQAGDAFRESDQFLRDHPDVSGRAAV